MRTKPIEDVLSGELIITPTGRWDRVHGVSDPENGEVVVNTDGNQFGRYPIGTTVNLV